jgi:hypothetical protein
MKCVVKALWDVKSWKPMGYDFDGLNSHGLYIYIYIYYKHKIYIDKTNINNPNQIKIYAKVISNKNIP